MMKSDLIRSVIRRFAIITLMVSFSIPALEAQTPGQSDDKKNSLVVYLWGASIDGNLGFRLNDRPFEITLQDLLKNLEMVGMLAYRRDMGDWSVLADLIYLKVGSDKSTSVDLPIGDDLTIDAEADLTVKSWVGGLYGGYAFSESSASKHQFIAGVRYLSMATNLHLEVDGPNGTPLLSRTLSPSVKLWDGVVGIEGHLGLGGRWRLPYHLDVGTGNSDLTYQALAGVAYGFRWGNLSLTYRYLFYDEGDDGMVKDLSLGGPVLGAGFRF